MVTKPASAQAAGYFYQYERALHRIFACKNTDVYFGIETDDDVAEIVKFLDGTSKLTLEQDKLMSKGHGQPFQDSSHNLWHTLHIWLDGLEKNLQEHKDMEFVFVTNKNVGVKSLARQLSDASTSDEIKFAIASLKNIAATMTGSVKDTATEVLGYPSKQLSYVIKNLTLADRNGVDAETLKQSTINILHIPEGYEDHADALYQLLLGNLIDRCTTDWKCSKPFWTTKLPSANLRQTFLNNLAIQNWTALEMLSTEYKEYIAKDAVEEHSFIRQLRTIGLREKQTTKALQEYWAWHSEKVRLLRKGFILDKHIESSESSLQERWENFTSNFEVANKKDSNQFTIEDYVSLYLQTLDGKHYVTLGKHTVNQMYYTNGQYHFMANGATKYPIHWHADPDSNDASFNNAALNQDNE
jgi:hypothetical protein